MTTFRDWFVIRTQPHRERWAAENVFRAGYRYYLPMVLEKTRVTQNGARRRLFRTSPLFPSYLFATADHGQWHSLLSLFGVVGIVPGSAGYPAIMRDRALNEIRGYETNGVVTLPKAPTGFIADQEVRIKNGSYSGYIGLVQGYSANERVQVLIDYMGRKVGFLVKEIDLEEVA